MDTSATAEQINCTYCIFWKLFPIDWEGCSHPARQSLPKDVNCPGFYPETKDLPCQN